MTTTALSTRSLRHTTEAPQTTRVLAFALGDSIRLFELRGELVRLGRGFAADLCLDDVTVSRRHAMLLTRPEGTVEILDEDSLSGTHVNGERVKRRVLRHGDVIRIGQTTITFLDVPNRWAEASDRT